MQVKLVYFRPDGGPKFIEVPKMPALIGRGDDCAVRAPVGGVSRRHCQIDCSDDKLNLKDLGSSNGTYINGSRVSQAQLKAGDVIQLGQLTLTVQIDGQPENPTKPAPKPQKKAAPETAPKKESANIDDFISDMFDDDDDDDDAPTATSTSTAEIDPIDALEDMDKD